MIKRNELANLTKLQKRDFLIDCVGYTVEDLINHSNLEIEEIITDGNYQTEYMGYNN